MLRKKMKFRIQNRGIASGLAVSALFTAHQDQTGATELDRFVDVDSIQAFDLHRITPKVETEESREDGATVVVEIPTEPVWEEASQMRFEELVEKYALEGKLNRKDDSEYRKLNVLRHRTHPSRSFDEIVADRELHKKVTEAVNSLKTLIEYATSTFPTKAKTNRF